VFKIEVQAEWGLNALEPCALIAQDFKIYDDAKAFLDGPFFVKTFSNVFVAKF
jgi:hypothetical protein